MPDNEFIPASLRIGASAAPRPEVPFDVLLRGINSNYAEWITNSPHWDRNDTRNLIITMKVALERMQQERDEARRMYCKEVEHHHETVWNDGERDFKPLPALDVAKQNGWDCYKEDDK